MRCMSSKLSFCEESNVHLVHSTDNNYLLDSVMMTSAHVVEM